MSDRFQLHSSVFADHQPIPRRFTADGHNLSPPLCWSGAPRETREFALIVDDPDAAGASPWVHWILYQIPASTGHLPENLPPSEHVPQPGGARQGRNSWGKIGYGGAAPPKDHGVHHYHFKLYALSSPLDLRPGATKEDLLAAMTDRILAQAETIGTYER